MSIGNTVPAIVKNITSTMADGWTGINIWRASSRNGTYTKIVDVGLPIPLVAGTVAYAFQDTVGNSGSWYRKSLWNGASDGELSEPEPGAGAPRVSARALRQECAVEAGVYMLPARNWRFVGSVGRASGTTTAAGTTTTVVCAEYSSSRYGDKAYQGASILLDGGVYEGEERQIEELNAGGSFLMADAFPGAPGNGVPFEGFIHLQSGHIMRAMERAFLNLWKPVTVPIGGISGRTEYALPYYLEDAVGQSLGLARRQGQTAYKHLFTGGYDYLLLTTDDAATLYLPQSLASNDVQELTAWRNPAPLFSDTDTILVGDQMRRLLCVTAAVELVKELSRPIYGAVEDVDVYQDWLIDLEKSRQALLREHPGWQSVKTRQSPMVSVTRALW